MWWSRAFALVALLLLTACGFAPVYGERGALPRGAQTLLANVTVEPIEEREGQMLRNVLLDQMNPGGMPAKPTHRLAVKVTESTQETSIQKNQFSSRANLVLQATYILARISDGKRVTSGSSRITASYDIVEQPYATLAAEADARARAVREIGEDITQRIASALTASSGTAAQ